MTSARTVRRALIVISAVLAMPTHATTHTMKVKRHVSADPMADRLGFIIYKGSGAGLQAVWGIEDVGQGSGALAWLTGDVDGDGKAEIIQPWRNGNALGFLVYGWQTSRLATEWGTGNVGQGYGALSWLAADVDGDKRTEIIQPWRNGSQLGFIVYGWDGTGLVARWGTGNVGQGYGALAWLTADVDGDGKAEIIQPWRNGSRLGFIVYGWDGSQLVARWGTGDVGQGYGALAWLTADVDGDGQVEIIQPWRNGSQLGFIVYGWDGTGLVARWGTGDVGQGYGALAWLAADVDGDGKAEIIQPWANGSRLGYLLYGWDGAQLVTRWGTGDMGQGSGALAWLTATIEVGSQTQIVQPWRNGSQLGYLVYGWSGGQLVTRWGTGDVGQGYGALAWLSADIDGDGRDEIIQPWKFDLALDILADASTVLKVADSAADVVCNVTLAKDGAVGSFNVGNGIINTQAELDAVMNVDGRVKLVQQVNWCAGGFALNIAGCGQLPGDSFIVTRQPHAQEGIMWAHEFGHNQGIAGDYAIANRVMNGTLANGNREVTRDECDNFQ